MSHAAFRPEVRFRGLEDVWRSRLQTRAALKPHVSVSLSFRRVVPEGFTTRTPTAVVRKNETVF